MVVKAGGNIMPRGDRSGPNGMGSMTGRGAGFCNGFNAPGYINTGVAGGYGRGMGAGRGFGGGFHRGPGRGYGIGFQPFYAAPVYSKETEKGYVENEVSFLKEQLKALEGRLAEMQDDEQTRTVGFEPAVSNLCAYRRYKILHAGGGQKLYRSEMI
eukprot:TRINITY_DN36821_c0_g1_i1.p2 TRINITY_DN36821_c0_g1~~TRINITY_DN36821_c0_g1_i1.p2  ORF type:complete len:156 (-),score=8.53 TRINITY_DN36821_c0_g1_i1:90-557(-)